MLTLRIFWNGLTQVEKQHTLEALSYQLGKVKSESVRQQNVNNLVKVDKEMAYAVADNVGVERPTGTNVPASESYPSLSQKNTPRYAYTQKVGVLISNGFNCREVTNLLNQLEKAGVFIMIVSEKLGKITGSDGTTLKVDETFLTSSPYLLDSLYVVGGSASPGARLEYDMNHYISNAYQHYKPIGVATSAESYFKSAGITSSPGVVFAKNNANFGDDFISAIAQQRFWDRK